MHNQLFQNVRTLGYLIVWLSPIISFVFLSLRDQPSQPTPPENMSTRDSDPIGSDWQQDGLFSATYAQVPQQHQYNGQPTGLVPHGIPHVHPSDPASVLRALENCVSELQSERDRVERAYLLAERSVAHYKAACAQRQNAQTPIISRLPMELLISIFFFVQNTVVASQVCRYWRVVALSCPRLWSSLHVHPSKGSKHLENLLARSQGHTIDVCFCPVPNMIPKPPPAQTSIQQHLSLPPIYTQQYHPDMCLTPHVVSILAPHAARLRSFELHATVPGTWLTLLPLITSPAPNLRTLHIYTKLHHDVARVPFFASHTPQLRNVQITGAFPVAQQSLLHNLTFLRLEGVPTTYRPTTKQLSDILKACPDLVSLSLLDAGPVPASDNDPLAGLGPRSGDEEGDKRPAAEISLPRLRAFAFRDTDIHLTTNTIGSVGMTWFGKNVHAPELAAFHLMLAPHPLAYVPRERAEFDVAGTPTGMGGGMVPVAGHSPYNVLSLMSIPPVSLAMRNKTTRILEAVPPFLKLQEMYLWAPHATAAEVRSLLMRFPKLKTLEMPMVRDPVETLRMFACEDATENEACDVPPTIATSVEEENVDGYFALGGGLYTDSHQSSTGSTLHDVSKEDLLIHLDAESGSGSSGGSPEYFSPSLGSPSGSSSSGQWLCPNLERIGIPHIIGREHRQLGDALVSVFAAREDGARRSAVLAGQDGYKEEYSVKRLSTLLAPSGRPAYINEKIWNWIGERARIQTLLPGEGGMDMLFDEISRDAT